MYYLAFAGPLLLAWLINISVRRWLLSYGLVRTNFQGKEIPTSFGVLLLLSAAPFYLFLARFEAQELIPLLFLAATVTFGGLGFIDDRWGDRSVGGLKGHFRQLVMKRQLTTGAAKAVFGSLAALGLAAALHPAYVGVWLLQSALIALCANALNLVDTRPVRALALFLGGSIAVLLGLILSRGSAPSVLWVLPGAALAYLPMERSRRGMLGDCGSNLLGGVLGLSFAQYLNVYLQAASVVLLLAFHFFTERRSLNAFIKEHPALLRVDEWVQGSPDVS